MEMVFTNLCIKVNYTSEVHVPKDKILSAGTVYKNLYLKVG
jgi:hypothetical protein